MFGTFLLALLVCLFGTAVFNHVTQRRMRLAISNLNGPFCIPGIGAVHLFFLLTPKNFIKYTEVMRRRYGKMVRIWAYKRLVVAITDLELIEQLLSSQQHIVKQRNYKMLHQWLGLGLLLSDGKKWQARRKIITPSFHFKILEQFVEIFDYQSQILLTRLMAKADGRNAFDIYPLICLAALDIIAETTMGTKINAQTENNNEYASAVNEITGIMAWRFIRFDLNFELLFSVLYPHIKLRQTKLIKIMHNFTTTVIKERRQALAAELNKSTSTVNIPEVDGFKKRMALLDVLLLANIDGKPLEDKDIREEVDTFMFEGHDTSTSAMGFALHLLARHDNVQTKLYDEICSVIGTDGNRVITLRDLNELKYTECVIKETLRMYPPVPVIGRDIVEDFHYTHSKLGNGIIPAGTELLVYLHGVLRDPENFKNPLEFKPERHEQNETSSGLTMLPFSAGPRNCIGQKFALLEIKMIIAKVVQRFQLLPLGADVQPELNIVLRSSTGFQLGLKTRNCRT